MWRNIVFVMMFMVTLFSTVNAGLWYLSDANEDSSQTDQVQPQVTYGNKGWQFRTGDGRFLLQIESRLQLRYAYPFESDPVTHEDFGQDNQNILKINRARLKIGGNIFQTWLKYYWEYELAAGNLLDFRMMIEKYPWLKIKVGQWKVHYNRERVISSGKQQMTNSK